MGLLAQNTISTPQGGGGLLNKKKQGLLSQTPITPVLAKENQVSQASEKTDQQFPISPISLTKGIDMGMQTTTPSVISGGTGASPTSIGINLGIGLGKGILSPIQTTKQIAEGFVTGTPTAVAGGQRGLSRLIEQGGKDIAFLAETLNLPGQLAEAITKGKIEAPKLKPVIFNQISQALEIKANKTQELAQTLNSMRVDVFDERALEEKLKDPEFIFRDLIGQNLPNLFISMGLGLAGQTLGGPIGGAMTAFTSAGLLEGGFAINEAIDFINESDNPKLQELKGDKDFQNKIGLTVGLINGILETLPITRLLNRNPAGKATKKKIIAMVLRNVIEQMISEGATEGLQEIVSNAVATIYDEDRDIFQGVAESMIAGGLLGAGGSVTTDVVQAGVSRIQEATPEEKQKGFIKMPFGEEPRRTRQTEPVTDVSKDPLAQEATIIKQAQEDYERAESEVFTLLELSKAGERLFTDEGVTGVSSTFPSFISPELRSKKLFNSVIDKTEKGIELKGSNEIKLKAEIEQAIFDKMDTVLANEKLASQFIQELETKKEKETNAFVKKIEQGIIDKLTSKRFSLLQMAEVKSKAKISKEAKIKQLESEFQISKEKAVRKAELVGGKNVIIQRFKALDKGLRKGRTLTRAEIEANQTEIIDILDKSNLDRDDKAKFIRAIKNVQTTEQLQKALPVIQERIERLEQAEFKQGIIKQVEEELKNIKPVKKGTFKVSKYDYETNKFLQNLKDISKYTQEKAQEELAKSKTEDLSQAGLITNRLLSFKANGAKSSLALQAQVLADIQDLKALGEEAKDELDFQKKLERQEKKDKILEGIKNQKESKGIFSFILKPLKSGYISSVSGLYDAVNTIAGKDIADKYNYGTHLANSKQDAFVKTEEAKNKAKEIYGVKSDRQLTKIFIDDLLKADYKITNVEGLSEDISKFDLINIYNGIKNELIKERYDNTFGEEQINSLLQNLSLEDAQMADYLMKDVQSYGDILNQRSIEIKGMDNGRIENYWPSVSEYMPEFFDDIKVQGEMPSAMKERSKSSRVMPRIANAWIIHQKHIAEAEHVKTVSRKYEELKNLFSDRNIRRAIETKNGDDAYRTLMKHIETLSLNDRAEGLDIVSGIYNSALNNWVKAKVASPTVFARQMISSIYSIGEVGIKNYVKYNKEFVANPKKAFSYMWDNVPYIRNRFKMGYSEALEDVIKGTKKMSVGMDSITKYTTLMTRGGDITAIMINGYPIIKTEMAKHGNMEKAIDVFQKFTLATQQDPTRTNISEPQRNRSAWHKTFFRFKNTVNQLLRLQVNANIQFVNKQISAKDYATKTMLYSVYTPMMYVLMGYAITQGWKALFGTDDEDETESLLGDFLQNIIVQPFQAIPFLDMATEWTYSKVRQKVTDKKYNYGMFSYPLFDDIERAGSKLFKEEPSAMDLLEAFSLIQEPATGIPTGTVLRYFKYTDKDLAKAKAETKVRQAEQEKRDDFKVNVYQKVQDLLNEGKETEADEMVWALSTEEQNLYKDLRNSLRTKNTKKLHELLESNPVEAVTFVRSRNEREKARLVERLNDKNSFTDGERQLYITGKQNIQ